MTGHPELEAAACSQSARTRGEPLAGTAPYARVWLVVEQPGPWGPRAVTDPRDSHLPENVFQIVQAANAVPGVKVLLCRRPGSHADDGSARTRTVTLASTIIGSSWLVQRAVSIDDLPQLDLVASVSAALDGSAPAWGTPTSDVASFVCTNGRRDRCCALRGRAAVEQLVGRWPDTTWECTHLGGHRFSPSVLVLPQGAVYGTADADDLLAVVEAAHRGEFRPQFARGLSALSEPAQAADLAVRLANDIRQVEAVRDHEVSQDGDRATVRLTVAGTPQTLTIGRFPTIPRPESCGAADVVGWHWSVTAVSV